MPIQAHAAEEDVLVFAAASLKNALDDVIAAYGQETGDQGDRVLRRELGPGQADRAGGAGAAVHLRRPRLDGLSRSSAT